MMDSWTVPRILPEKSGIGPVQCCDNAWSQCRRQHFAGEDGRGGMRHSVMHVQHVQPEVSADFSHFDGERKSVVGIFEKVVIVNDDGVKVKTLRIRRQAKGPFIADEMNFVPEPGQVFTEG